MWMDGLRASQPGADLPLSPWHPGSMLLCKTKEVLDTVLFFSLLTEINGSLREAQKCLQHKADEEPGLLREHFKENRTFTIKLEM